MAVNLNPYWLVTTAVEYSDGAAAYTVGEIPAKTLVMSTCIIVTTGFVGTSPTLDLGDEDNADVFVDATDMTEETIGAYWGDGGDATAFEGAWYPAKKGIVLTLGGTGLTAGVAYGVLQCLDLSNTV